MNDNLQQEAIKSTSPSANADACACGPHMGDAQARLQDALHGLRTHLNEFQDTAMHRTREALRSTDAAVHQHPYGILAAIAVAGLLIGFFAARR